MTVGGGKERSWRWAIAAVAVTMLTLAAWAWWVPNGVFRPWIARAHAWIRR